MQSSSLWRTGSLFLLTPLREGRPEAIIKIAETLTISTHAPAGGATRSTPNLEATNILFLLTPLREGRRCQTAPRTSCGRFLLTPLREGRPSRPRRLPGSFLFLLTPLREGRLPRCRRRARRTAYFYSRPCGRGDSSPTIWLLPLGYFYSRPCGRGDRRRCDNSADSRGFLLTPLREGRPGPCLPRWPGT